MKKIHPLLFEPIFQTKLWGGRGLQAVLGKALPPVEPIGESWEVVDLPDHKSVVRTGPSKGMTLSALMGEWGSDLYGTLPIAQSEFPLLIKFIDAREALSVQVHPPRSDSHKLAPNVRPKDEAWYILDCNPGAFLYVGMHPNVDRTSLMTALEQNRPDDVLLRVPVQPGDAFYLPGGTVHAIGGGILLAEVQTPSDTTFRLYDFGRTDPQTGQPRKLHIEEALACIDFNAGPPPPQERSHLASVWTTVTRVVTCPHFYMERVRMVEGAVLPINYGGMVIWIVLSGEGEISSPHFEEMKYRFGKGDVVLIPAALKDAVVEIRSSCTWLETAIPQPSSLAGFERPSPSQLKAPPEDLVQLGTPRKTKPQNGM